MDKCQSLSSHANSTTGDRLIRGADIVIITHLCTLCSFQIRGKHGPFQVWSTASNITSLLSRHRWTIPLEVKQWPSNLGIQFAGWLGYYIGHCNSSEIQETKLVDMLVTIEHISSCKKKEAWIILTSEWQTHGKSGFLSFHFRINKIRFIILWWFFPFPSFFFFVLKRHSRGGFRITFNEPWHTQVLTTNCVFSATIKRQALNHLENLWESKDINDLVSHFTTWNK